MCTTEPLSKINGHLKARYQRTQGSGLFFCREGKQKKMSKYEKLLNLKNKYERKAAATSDNNLRIIYKNAAKGCEIKANSLTILEAAK